MQSVHYCGLACSGGRSGSLGGIVGCALCCCCAGLQQNINNMSFPVIWEELHRHPSRQDHVTHSQSLPQPSIRTASFTPTPRIHLTTPPLPAEVPPHFLFPQAESHPLTTHHPAHNRRTVSPLLHIATRKHRHQPTQNE